MNNISNKIKNLLKYLSNLFHKLLVSFSKLSFKKRIIFSLSVCVIFLFIFVLIPALGNLIGGNDNYSVNVKEYDNLTSLTTIYNNQFTQSTRVKVNFSKTISSNDEIYNDDAYFNLNISSFLPNDVKIIMIDNINEEVYEYVLDSFAVNIPLTNFYKSGDGLYDYFNYSPNDYYSSSDLEDNEDFDFIFDFSNSNITENADYTIELQIIENGTSVTGISDSSSNIIRLVKYDSNNNLITSGITLSTTFNSTINFSSTLSNTVVMNAGTSFPTYNSYSVYDNNMDNRSYYLDITFNDSSNNLITGNSINNVTFSINGSNYYSTDSGHINIPLSSLTNNSINITPAYAVNTILNGNYTLKFKVVCSNCINDVSSNIISIPVSVNNATTNIDCDFGVTTPENDRIISKSGNTTYNGTTTTNYTITYDGELSDPKVLVSLYKKSNYTSENQTYDMVNLNTLLNTTLSSSSITNKYVLISSLNSSTSSSTLNLKCNSFDIGGYKLVFDLYDGSSLIKSVEKTIIVK